MMKRFQKDTDSKRKLTTEVKEFVSRMYRLDGTLTKISPGTPNRHVDLIDFNQSPTEKKYKFQRLRPDDYHQQERKDLILRIIDETADYRSPE